MTHKLNKPTKIPYKDFKEIYHKVTRVTVEIILLTRNGVVLTLRSIEPFKNQWHTPGGSVLYKESVEDAVKRVCLEELGVKVKIKKFLGYWEVPEWKEKEGFCHSIGLIHQVEIKSGKLRGNDQSSKIESFKKIPNNTIDVHKKFLINFLSSTRLPE